MGKLFDSPARVKILRLFLLNPDSVFPKKEAGKRSQVRGAALSRELSLLSRAKLITPNRTGLVTDRKTGKVKKTKGFELNQRFPLLAPLRGLLVSNRPYSDEEIIRRFNHTGRLKLVVISGIFMHEPHSRVDILLVGDNLKKNLVEAELRTMEAEVGKELEYAILDTKEFDYRLEVYDKFIRDILDYSHRKILNKGVFVES